MSLKPFTRVYDEFIGDTFAIPAGRLVGAELRVLPFSLASGSQANDDTLQLVIEIRSAPDAEFEAAAHSRVLSQYEEATEVITLPVRDGASETLGSDRPPVARFRLIHAGRQQPRYDLRLIGV